MQDAKIRKFMALAGQQDQSELSIGSLQQRKLGAQLLLSEVLEYVIKGLGVTPVVNGTPIKDPNALQYEYSGSDPNKLEMIDGLADVAYTMYWNSSAFGVPLEDAFEDVCDNNLQKFVPLSSWTEQARPLERPEWHCDQNITWPESVVEVHVIAYQGEYYAVGKDQHGKVRKPSSYVSVDLRKFLNE